jgi:RNA polymerase sigma factor (sigma-70 family)
VINTEGTIGSVGSGAGAVPDTLSERAGALFAAFRAGDDAKMGELVALLTPILWHTARAQNVSRDSAEDVLQGAWLALVRTAGTIADPRAVLGWLIVTVRREAWRVARVDRRADPHDFEPDAIVAPVDAGPENTAVRDSGQNRLWAHISELPERCQRLLRVIAFADRPDYAAVAVALGMPVGSIGPTRGRCLAKLRAQLSADPRWEL